MKKYLRLKEVAAYMSVSTMTIYRWRESLGFPAPLNVGTDKKKSRPLWDRDIIDSWVKDKSGKSKKETKTFSANKKCNLEKNEILFTVGDVIDIRHKDRRYEFIRTAVSGMRISNDGYLLAVYFKCYKFAPDDLLEDWEWRILGASEWRAFVNEDAE